MSPVVVTTDVARPAGEVFAYATDPNRFPHWQQGVIDGGLDTSGPVRIGALCRTTRRIGGANRESTSEVTHIDPPHAWGVRGIDGPIRAMVDLTIEPLREGSSRLTIAVDFEGRGIGRVLVPLLVRRQARKEMPVNVATLKQRVESQHTRGGAGTHGRPTRRGRPGRGVTGSGYADPQAHRGRQGVLPKRRA